MTTVVADLTSEKAEYLQTITKLLSTHAADAALVLAVHNAGSVGDIHLRSHEMNDVARWHSHLQSNLIAAILLNNAVYNSVADAVNASKTRFVAIDITSLAAIRAGPSWTQVSKFLITTSAAACSTQSVKLRARHTSAHLLSSIQTTCECSATRLGPSTQICSAKWLMSKQSVLYINKYLCFQLIL